MQKVISELARLPSIGEKSAVRLANHLINGNGNNVFAQQLASALIEAADKVKLCESCFFYTEGEQCRICQDESRDSTVICVVEKPMDLIAIERVGEFKGYYHVLHGVWSPLRGKGAESIRLQELVERLKDSPVKEVILATGTTVEGDATAMYVSRMVSESGIRTSRLAQGVPKGGDLEYLDDVTLSRALAGRGRLGL